MYRPTDKMSELMGVSSDRTVFADNQVLQLLHRFGIPLGVSDKSIYDICQENGVDCNTLLAVVNFAQKNEYHPMSDIDIPTLRLYLENAHVYFLDFQLPRIRQMLLEAISLSDGDKQIPMLIIQFFDNYVNEIRAHIAHENDYTFEQHATDDDHIAMKAHELKNLRLHGNVERRRRLVGDYEIWAEHQRHRDHHALLHSAGKFMRISARARLRIGNPHLSEPLDGHVPRRLF